MGNNLPSAASAGARRGDDTPRQPPHHTGDLMRFPGFGVKTGHEGSISGAFGVRDGVGVRGEGGAR